MNRQEYLKSFLNPGQKRLPRKLKKKFSKCYTQGGPLFVLNQTQFFNLYQQKQKYNIEQGVERLLNTSVREITYIPARAIDFNTLKKKMSKELYDKAGKPNVAVELTDISTRTLEEINNCKDYLI